MAHFIVEYSANLGEDRFKPTALLGELISAAVATDIFPEAGCRGRAHRCDDFYVADGRADFAFVHLQVRLGAGRTDDELTRAQEALANVLETHLKAISESQGLAISLELVELPEHKANINNIRQYLPK